MTGRSPALKPRPRVSPIGFPGCRPPPRPSRLAATPALSAGGCSEPSEDAAGLPGSSESEEEVEVEDPVEDRSEAEEGSDTDLDLEEAEGAPDTTQAARYLAACRGYGAVPVSAFFRHMTDSELSLPHHGLGPQDARALADTLMTNTCIVKLNLRDNVLSAPGAEAIAGMLKENCFLSDVDLSENKLGDGGIQTLCAALLDNSTLLRLGLSGNHLGARAAGHLADSLLVNHKVESLDLSHNQLDDRAGEFLGRALAENTGVKELSLGWNHIHSPGAVALARGLEVDLADGKGCSRLPPQNTLLCGSPAPSPVGSRYHGDPCPQSPSHVEGGGGVGPPVVLPGWAGRTGPWGSHPRPHPPAPQANIFLKVLDVSYNGFGDPGAAALGEALRGNNVLEELDVSNNRISPSGALRLASGLRENRTLRTLVMARNPMRSEGCVGVLKSVQANARSSLEMLDFTDISVNKDFRELSEAVRGLFPRLHIVHGGFPAPFRRDRPKIPDEAAA